MFSLDLYIPTVGTAKNRMLQESVSGRLFCAGKPAGKSDHGNETPVGMRE